MPIPDFYPLARPKLDGKGSGAWSKRGEWKILLHTTETRGMPGYKGGTFAPHVTYFPKHRTWTQHFPFARPAESIKSFDNDQVIQVEIICYSERPKAEKVGGLWVANLSNPNLDDLAEFAVWVMDHLNVPVRWPGVQAFSAGEANAKGFRFDAEGFRAFGGLLGHQHTPKPNTHWDPGGFPWEKLIARIEEDDLFSKSLDPETWGVLFDRRIVEGGSPETTRQEVIDFWTSPDRTREDHRHATNVIVRGLAQADEEGQAPQP